MVAVQGGTFWGSNGLVPDSNLSGETHEPLQRRLGSEWRKQERTGGSSREIVWRSLPASGGRGGAGVLMPNRRSLVRRGQVEVHRIGRLLQRRWFAFLDYSHHEDTSVRFRALLKEHGFTAGASIPFGSPIPRWLQRREFGGSLLAFCATRE